MRRRTGFTEVRWKEESEIPTWVPGCIMGLFTDKRHMGKGTHLQDKDEVP